MDDLPFPPAPKVSKKSALAVWSLVLGILGLPCSFLLLGIPAVICGHLALSRIKRSDGMLTGNGLAINGLVTGYIGIVVAIFIGIPGFMRARNIAMQNACISNLRCIETAKQLWARDLKKQEGDTPTVADLSQFMKSRTFPVCPAGGQYTIGTVAEDPSCSILNHGLPSP